MTSLTMTFPAPVELPTKRNSYHSSKPVQDIHSPGWIPILDNTNTNPSSLHTPTTEKELSPYNNASFPPIPLPSPNMLGHKATPKHSYSTSSSAPEHIATELAAPLPQPPPVPREGKRVNAELPATRPQSRYYEGRGREKWRDEGQDADTDGTGDSSAKGSVGTSSLLDQQVYTLPLQSSSKDDFEIPTFPSATSTRKSQNIPTSKYSRKPLPSASRVASAAPSVAHTPQPSPKITPAVPPLSRQPSAVRLTRPPSPQQQQPPTPQQPQPPAPRQRGASKSEAPLPITSNAAAMAASKSTASQRRQRALHSHPSNVSLKSRPNSSSDDSDTVVTARPPVPRAPSQKSRKSTDSRTTPRCSTFDLQTPTPAPTTPLPELPSHARTPTIQSAATTPILPSTSAFTSSEPLPRQPQLPQSAHLPIPQVPATEQPRSHAEMASFMTAANTVIFRRFDEVHVQLLLSLQDEITQLERDLMKLDAVKDVGERGRVLRELRKVVGEYDHLFSSWSQMQASKVSKSTTQNLKQWLERPSTSAGAGLKKDAKDDLEWLERNNKDLSSVVMDSSENGRSRGNSRATLGGGGGVVGGGAGGGMGGFIGLFGGCAGKRK